MVKEIWDQAERINKLLTCDGFPENGMVRVITIDDSEFVLKNAIVLCKGDFWIVLSEHFRPLVFHDDEVSTILEYELAHRRYVYADDLEKKLLEERNN